MRLFQYLASWTSPVITVRKQSSEVNSCNRVHSAGHAKLVIVGSETVLISRWLRPRQASGIWRGMEMEMEMKTEMETRREMGMLTTLRTCI